MKPRLVLFDLDGTLADTAPDIARVTNQVLAEAGRPPLSLSQVRATVSFGARALLLSGFDKTPEEIYIQQLLGKLFLLYSKEPSRETRAFPGLAELISSMAGHDILWGVVTNKPAALAAPIVAALGVAPPPACLIGGDTFPRKKPDPMPLIEACRQVGVTPDEAFYVGDANIDAQAAGAAGLPFVVAGFGYAPPRSAVRSWGKLQYAGDAAALARIVGLRMEPAAGAI